MSFNWFRKLNKQIFGKNRLKIIRNVVHILKRNRQKRLSQTLKGLLERAWQ